MPNRLEEPRVFVVIIRVSSPVTTMYTPLFVMATNHETAHVVAQEVANEKFNLFGPHHATNIDTLSSRAVEDAIVYSTPTAQYRVSKLIVEPIEK